MNPFSLSVFHPRINQPTTLSAVTDLGTKEVVQAVLHVAKHKNQLFNPAKPQVLEVVQVTRS